MIHDELILQFATTADEHEAGEIILLIVALFLAMYDDEKQRFAKESKIDLPDAHDTVKDEYALYVTDVLYDMRERSLEKKRDLTAVAIIGAALLLKKFVMDNFSRIEATEKGNLKQTAQLQVVKYAQSVNHAATYWKRWVAYPDCCKICKALNGRTIPIDENFLVSGQVVDLGEGNEFTYDYIPRGVAIAHPNDRCHIEFIIKY